MNPGMAGDDAALDAHVASIAAKLRGGATEDKPDTRENREDRDITDVSTSDLEESERIEREAANQDGESQDHAEAETEGAEKAEDDAEAFIELPPAEEGGEPERIPVSEATEAVKQLRQMNGDIATAVIKAETEAYEKQDRITQAMSGMLGQIEHQARTALAMMDQFLPQAPDPVLLDENSGYYDPAYYHKSKLYYDSYMAHRAKVEATLKQAQSGQQVIGTQVDSEYARREAERTSRFIPEFKDEKTREARKSEILDTLGKLYGVTKQELDEIVDHKAWRMMHDLAKLKAAEKKAPEVKKHLQETKPKIVNGRVSQTRDPKSGQFINQARKELKETGSEDAFARMLMRSGAVKDLMRG